MTREQAKWINYKVGEMIVAFDREFPTIEPEGRLNRVRNKLVHKRNEVSTYLLENQIAESLGIVKEDE